MNFHRLSTFFNYHPEVKGAFRRFEKIVYCLFRLKNQKFFLEECLQEQVIPKMYGFNRWTTQADPFPNSHQLFLEERIEYTKNDIFITRRNLKKTQDKLRLLCSSYAGLLFLLFTPVLPGTVCCIPID